MTATLTATSALTLRWSLDDAVGLSTISNVGNLREAITISDAAVCNAVWADSRTLAARTVEGIDLTSLPYGAFGLAGTFSFTAVHKVFVANSATTAAELRVGVPDNETVGHYAISVWQQSHSFLYSEVGWTPAGLLRIANVSDIAIPYQIILIGRGAVASS